MRIFALAAVLLGVFISLARAETLPPDPGDDLLRAMKLVVDSGRADDPASTGALLHLNLVRTAGSLNPPGTCPAGAYQFENEYGVIGDSWFHSLPTGKKDMRLANIVGDIGMRGYRTVGDPAFRYFINSEDGHQTNCAGPGVGLVRSIIDFNNIPSYACISEAQIAAIFPKIFLIQYGVPSNISYFEYLARGQYSGPVVLPHVDPNRPYDTPVTGYVGVDKSKPYAYVDFTMTEAPLDNQPPCLLDLHLDAGYRYGPLHRPDTSKFVPYQPPDSGCLVFQLAVNRGFCEAGANYSVRTNLNNLFNQSLVGETPSQQTISLQEKSELANQIDGECTEMFRQDLYVDFGCATTLMTRQFSVLISKSKTEPPPLVSSGLVIFMTGGSGDECQNEGSRLEIAYCQYGDARRTAEDFRNIFNDYVDHLESSEKPGFLISHKAWRRYLDGTCTKKSGDRQFVNFLCADELIAARAHLLAVALSAPVSAYDGQYVVLGSSMPWLPLGGCNDHFGFTSDGAGPTVLSLAGLQAHPGQKLTIKYLSGTITDSAGRPLSGPAGMWNAAVSGERGLILTEAGKSAPAIMGTFTNSTGNMTSECLDPQANAVFGIAAGGSTEQIPAGATQLQLGINRGSFAQNFGSLRVSVKASD
jgi:hypothetical protein